MASREHDREQGRGAEAEQRAPEPPELNAVERLASNVGNQAFGALAREGAGILPDGRAHPDVESAIAQTRGGGSALDSGVAGKAGPQLGDDFSDVRVHTGEAAETLASSVSAKAFTTGNDIYFGKGEYNPGSSDGDRLLTHELSHVVQQRGAPTSGPLQVSEPGDRLEQEADEAARGLA